MSGKLRSYRFVGLGLYIAICLPVDLIPKFGPPHFRYIGSDPLVAVWNFAWPLTIAIWAPKNGLHFGPFAYLVIPFQLITGAGAYLIAVLLNRLRSVPKACQSPYSH